MITVRDVTNAHLDVLLPLTQADSPAPGSLGRARALLLVLYPGADYRSLNHRWFAGRFRNSLHVAPAPTGTGAYGITR